jgi:hypothetical protein
VVTGAAEVTKPKPMRRPPCATVTAGGIEAAAESVPAAAFLVRTDKEAQMFEPLEMPEPQPESDDDDDDVVIVDDVDG